MKGIASDSQPLASSFASAESPCAVGVAPVTSPLAASAAQRFAAAVALISTIPETPTAVEDALASIAHGS